MAGSVRYQTWRPPEGVRTRRVERSVAGLGLLRRAARTARVWNPLASPVRSMCSAMWMPGRILSRAGTGAWWASMSMTTSPAGPQATPTPSSGRAPHHWLMRSRSRVAAWKLWHQRPSEGQVHELWECPGRRHCSQFPAGVLRPFASGRTGQPLEAHSCATCSERPATEASPASDRASLGENCSSEGIYSPFQRPKRLNDRHTVAKDPHLGRSSGVVSPFCVAVTTRTAGRVSDRQRRRATGRRGSLMPALGVLPGQRGSLHGTATQATQGVYI